MIKNTLRGFLAVVATSVMLSSAASAAHILVNGGFEDNYPGGAEENCDAGVGNCGGGWTNFGNSFRVSGDPEPVGTSGGAFEGDVALKTFGGGGVFQDLAVTADANYQASVYMLNPNNADAFGADSSASLKIIWLDSLGGIISDAAANAGLADLMSGVWTLFTIDATAPTNAVTARFQLQHDMGPGAVRFDDANFQQVVPIPGALLLMGPALLGLIGFRRKNA